MNAGDKSAELLRRLASEVEEAEERVAQAERMVEAFNGMGDRVVLTTVKKHLEIARTRLRLAEGRG